MSDDANHVCAATPMKSCWPRHYTGLLQCRRRGVVVASLVKINEVNLRWARLVSKKVKVNLYSALSKNLGCTGMGDRVRVRLPEAALYFGM